MRTLTMRPGLWHCLSARGESQRLGVAVGRAEATAARKAKPARSFILSEGTNVERREGRNYKRVWVKLATGFEMVEAKVLYI
jgi:hypothetical protein